MFCINFAIVLKLDSEFKLLIETLNKQSFISICMVKQQISKGLDKTFQESIDIETKNQKSRISFIVMLQRVCQAFFEKRLPEFKNTLDE